MSLIIDGYNVLYQSRFAPGGGQASELKAARESLLDHLHARIPFCEHKYVCIVFDTANKRRKDDALAFRFPQLQIHFARDHDTADDFIIEMIQQDDTPQKLLVVSSDHRIQVAAKRRGALWIDSDVWYDSLENGTHKQLDTNHGTREAKQKSDEAGKHETSFLQEKDGLEIEDDNPFPEGYGEDLG